MYENIQNDEGYKIAFQNNDIGGINAAIYEVVKQRGGDEYKNIDIPLMHNNGEWGTNNEGYHGHQTANRVENLDTRIADYTEDHSVTQIHV